jgi:hypothetical protein
MSADNYITALNVALLDQEVTVSVSDASEDYFDLEHSRKMHEIVEACEATDSPVITFFKGKQSLGYLLVLVGYGDESIADYGVNAFIESIVEGV